MKESETEVKRGTHYNAPVIVIMAMFVLLALVSFGLAIYIFSEVQQLQDRTASKKGFQSWLKEDEQAEIQTTDLYSQLTKLKQENNRLKVRLSLTEMKTERRFRMMHAMILSRHDYNINSTPIKTNTELNQTLLSRQRRAADDPTTGEVTQTQCVQGPPGRDGRDGERGPPGTDGINAEELKKVLSTFQETTLSALKIKSEVKYLNGTSGAVYIRWGRTTCPDTSTLLYDGIAAGSSYSHSGGGSEKLCLPHKPQWGLYQDGFQSNSYIYGSEYEEKSNKVFSRKNANDAGINDHDVPCAVCYTPSRASQLMIPAWRDCPATWTKEYSGYLMAERYSHHRSSFNCVDEAPEVIPGGSPDQNGALFYNVEAKCGSLPCPNYVDGRELTCVICTK